MRQVGVLAAPGLIALEEMPKRLHEDHANARFLAHSLARIPGITVTAPQTNIVIFDVSATGMKASEIKAGLKERGVLINPITPAGTTMRAVTHFDAPREKCERAVEALESVFARASASA
jgi:threonine aldolase